ncbi:MAG: hypothetical protein WCR36_09040 [Bacteroidaceae bacterium]
MNQSDFAHSNASKQKCVDTLQSNRPMPAEQVQTMVSGKSNNG